MAVDSADSGLTVVQARLYLVVAALLWSLSGILTRLLQVDIGLGLHEPKLEPLQIAFFRVLFAGLVFVPLLRREMLTFRPLMVGMVAAFAIMNGLFVSAMALGSAANAILLQYTAPLWMYLVCVYLLNEKPEPRGKLVIAIALTGIAVIAFGGMTGDRGSPPEGNGLIIMLALGSGFFYAWVLIGLRLLHEEASPWLTFLNHFGGALLLLPFVIGLALPTIQQIFFLVGFGVVQMGLPYFLMARALTKLSPQEAAVITLIEPLLNPLWAYLIAPKTETPPLTTWIGGLCILAALFWKYLPELWRPPASPTLPPEAAV